MAAPKPCVTSGCPHDALPGRSRCDTHHRSARQQSDRRRGSAAARGYDAKWNRRTRPQHLKMSPHCTCTGCPSCQRLTVAGRCLRPATDVDHIDGLGPHGPRGHDHDNLRSLCHECHAHRTGRDQGRFAG